MANPADRVVFRPENGLGDRLLDVIGAHLWCTWAGKRLVLDWASSGPDRTYDASALLRFGFGVTTLQDEVEDGKVTARLVSQNAAVSLSPIRLVLSLGTGVGFRGVCDMFRETAVAMVGPPAGMVGTFPEGLDQATGIHLRRSDKVHDRPTDAHDTHEATWDRYAGIMARLWAFVDGDMHDGASYYVCSEEPAYLSQFVRELRAMAVRKGCSIRVLPQEDPPPPSAPPLVEGGGAVFDLFCLSKCRRILQGINHSSFSIVAALVGGGVPLFNFATHSPRSMLYLWAPCLDLTCPGLPRGEAEEDAVRAASGWTGHHFLARA